MRIFIYVVIILAGAYLGAGGKMPANIMDKLSRLQFLSLLFMLFVMGINIGVNEDVVNGFYRLGFQAVVLAAFSIAFSILFVKLVAAFVQRDRKESE